MDTEDQTLLNELSLKFSHNIIEHLGLKLYQNKPTNVLAELVSNSWDANANNVWINIKADDAGSPLNISVSDDGDGMDLQSLKDNYLVIGKIKDGSGPDAKKQKRPPMGRKGIGKLAPFGVAKELHLVTIQDNNIIWLKFDYEQISSQDMSNAQIIEYKPEQIAINVTKDSFDIQKYNLDNDIKIAITNFLEKTSNKGTLILAKKLTLKKLITPSTLAESLARRFTIILCNPDFKVLVNDDEITEERAFPPWELRIPNNEWKETILSDGKKIRFWIGFVKEASWPIEQSGVGIYAHGKIAQDRPFFFGVKGLEIATRYMYGQIEADWIDELPDDVISTDRTSIDWENDNFSEFKIWGEKIIREWIADYRKYQSEHIEEENKQNINKIVKHNPRLKLREAEQGHLLQLLNDVTPKLSKDSEQREKFIETTMKAWLHDPARRLIKKLWERATTDDAEAFFDTVTKLTDELVPESLSLATVFAQRVFALSKLQDRILHGKETDLQKLIEQFPWILSNEYERYAYRQELKTMCEKAENEMLISSRDITFKNEKNKPDFVFFGTPENREILIVELKSPNETASEPEYEQLHGYMKFLQSRFPNSKVKGILIARDFSPVLDSPTYNLFGMNKVSWDAILLNSRRGHMDLLVSLVANNDENLFKVSDVELTGEIVQSFLNDMAKNDSTIKELMKIYSPKQDK